MRGLLLVEGSHTKLLVDESLVFSARGTVTIVSVVAESRLIQVAEMGHNCIDTTKESLILFNDIELITTATKSSNGLTQILRQNLQSSVCLFSTDEDFSNYSES